MRREGGTWTFNCVITALGLLCRLQLVIPKEIIPFQSFCGDLWLCIAGKQFMWLINPRWISQVHNGKDCQPLLRPLLFSVLKRMARAIITAEDKLSPPWHSYIPPSPAPNQSFTRLSSTILILIAVKDPAASQLMPRLECSHSYGLVL